MKVAAATTVLVMGLGSVALAHDPFPEWRQKIETRLQNELAKIQQKGDRAKGQLDKRSGIMEKQAQKEAERIKKIQAEIAALEQKVAAAKTAEEKELLTLRLDNSEGPPDSRRKGGRFREKGAGTGPG